MSWDVYFHDEFEAEFNELAEAVQDELLALIGLLQEFGFRLARPHADTLKGSKFASMKELRFKADDGVWRVVFAFDPKQAAIILVAGDKTGTSEKRFYKQLIRKADQRFQSHLDSLEK